MRESNDISSIDVSLTLDGKLGVIPLSSVLTEPKKSFNKLAFSASVETGSPDLDFRAPILCDRPSFLLINLK